MPTAYTLSQYTCDIDLNAGINKIKIMADSAYSPATTPDIDKITISLKTGLPEDIYFVEAEDACQKTGSSSADSDCSGGYKVIDVGPNSS